MDKNKAIDFVLELREAKHECEVAEKAWRKVSVIADITAELRTALIAESEDFELSEEAEGWFEKLECQIDNAEVCTYKPMVSAQDKYICLLEKMLTESMGVTFDFDENGNARIMLSE